jgi:hypothetical protein
LLQPKAEGAGWAEAKIALGSAASLLTATTRGMDVGIEEDETAQSSGEIEDEASGSDYVTERATT